jgi:hypothetical protein
MRSPTKSGFAMATILAASFGFSGLTQAAPLTGVAAAVPAVQTTQNPLTAEAQPEKAHHHPLRPFVHPEPKHQHHSPRHRTVHPEPK